ncbi:uncharacterized protein BO97DRAFT_354313, partial [Aspergillus homomorphus CBS 101889]
RSQLSRSSKAEEQSNAGGPIISSAMSLTNARPKRNPRRAANKQWSEEQLMTSTKSQLIHLDLVKLLAHPEAWTCLEENEKEEILKLLPNGAHPNPYPSPDDPEAKIPPPPESFLRYSNNWRDGIRQFQLDLQQGRYDPEWLREAEIAIRERAAGKFDRFKEEEFEEFWGQKQKMDRSLQAGQSSQIKLMDLTDNGVICEGDILKYSRAFAKGSKRVLVEKEARIVKIEGANLTFAVPPGQRVFLSTAPAPTTDATSPNDCERSTNNTETTGITNTNGQHEDGKTILGSGPGPNAQGIEAGSARKRKSDVELPDSKRQCSELQANSATCHLDPEITALTLDQPQGVEEIILPNIQGLGALASKITEIDGRITKRPNGNSWKEFRAYRHNQDMGSLWELRQAWFVRENKSRTTA